MSTPCEMAGVFVDGELPPEAAEDFRHHLVDCVRCQREVADLMQLKFLGQGYAERAAAEHPSEAPSSSPFLARWRYPLLGAAASLAVALVVVWAVRSPSTPSLQHDVWLAQASQRQLEARISYPGADRYRPLAAKMMGSAAPSADLPLEDMAVLEKKDPHGLVAAYLVHDDPALAEQALRKLKGLDSSPDLDSDRAVAMLLKGQSEEALRLLDSALARDPRHPQALWNQGLVLRQLGLPLLAAQSFSQVAALKEPGWSEEAAQKAEALRSAESERHLRYNTSSRMIENIIDGRPARQLNAYADKPALARAVVGEDSRALPPIFSQLPSARRLFYEAVRTASDRTRVLALLPTAQELDMRAGDKVLEGYVRRLLEADFQRRAPLAAAYAALRKGTLSQAETERFLAELIKSKEDDILLGALFATGATAQHLELYEAKAAASGDPWFLLLAAEERVKADTKAGNWMHAVQTLLDTGRLCTGHGLEYRCIARELALSSLYIKLHQFELARTYAETSWKTARALGEWPLESSLLWNLATVVRARGDTALARAYLLEFLERDKSEADIVRRAHQELAVMAMQDLDIDEARREIDAALATGRPLGVPGVFALADIARLKREPEDEARLTQAVEKLVPGLSPGERLITTHVLGRFFIEHDPEKGRDLLWKAIHEAEAPGLAGDSGARRARTYSFTSLILAAGHHGDFQEALKLMEQERGVELPRSCLLAAAADSERILFLVRGDDGALAGHYDDSRREPLPQRLDGLLPQELHAKLARCEQTQVLARPPLNGRTGLLPSTLAWSYLTRTSAPRAAPPGPAVHLVVSNVELPAGVPLKQLNPWQSSFGTDERREELSGAEATPSRVLDAMKSATEIDLVAHGILNDSFNDSYLMLASEPGGPQLGMAKVRSASLQGAPFVVLVACHAAHTSFSPIESLSLPAAFIEAGARGVLAATVEIPDLEAQAFFSAVRERMRSGRPPALALHDERTRWLSEGRGTQWLDSVLLFE